MEGNTMNLTLRLGRPDDTHRCGTIFYEAFKVIAEYHGFPRDSSGPERGIANFARWLSHPGYHVIVTELDGHIVGSNVLDERSTIVGLGPLRSILRSKTARSGANLCRPYSSGWRSARLLGCGWSKLPITTGLSPCIRRWASKSASRLSRYRATIGRAGSWPHGTSGHRGDLDGCNALCRRIHGHDRGGELLDAMQRGTATVVEHGICSPAMRPWSGTMVMPWGRATQTCRR